jgi:hypothetical protein
MLRALLCDSFDKVPPNLHFPTQSTKSCHGRKFAFIYSLLVTDFSLIKSLLIVEQFQYQESGLTDLHCFGLLSRLRPVLAVTDSESTRVSPFPSDPPRTRPGRSAVEFILNPSVTFDFQT